MQLPSMENNALETEDLNTKHPELENEAPRTLKQRIKNLRMKGEGKGSSDCVRVKSRGELCNILFCKAQ